MVCSLYTRMPRCHVHRGGPLASAQRLCVSAKRVLQQWQRKCRSVADCDGVGEQAGCVTPAELAANEVMVRVAVRVAPSGQASQAQYGTWCTWRGDDSLTPHVLDVACRAVAFAGHAVELAYALSVSDLAPRSGIHWLPGAAAFPLTFSRVLRLTVALSATMAVFNMLPVFVTDGEHVSRELLALVMPKAEPSVRRRLHRRLLWVGSGLLLLTLGSGFASLIL